MNSFFTCPPGAPETTDADGQQSVDVKQIKSKREANQTSVTMPGLKQRLVVTKNGLSEAIAFQRRTCPLTHALRYTYQ